MLGTVVSDVSHIAFPAQLTFDFSGKAVDVQALVCPRSQSTSSCHLFLHIVESFLVDNRFMGVCDEILRKLTAVFLALLGNGIFDKLFLTEQISRISDIGQNNLNIGVRPAVALSGCNAFLCKFTLGFKAGFSIKEVLKDAPHDPCFFGNNNQGVILPAVAIDVISHIRVSFGHAFSDGPFDVVRDADGFFLCERGKEREHQLTVIRK